MPQCSPECTAMEAIFSQNTVNVACKKNLAFRLPWPPSKISDLDKIHMVDRGLLQKHFLSKYLQ